ncbi:MAG: PPOX class F420-dependent oxidoreductase [Thermoleophilia bacterium]
MDDVVRAFLEGRHMATLGTTNPDGSIQLTAVWYALEGDTIHVITSSGSRKVRNIVREGRASIMVDSHERGPLRGAAGSGPADVVQGEEAARWNARILERYLSPEAVADPRVGGVMRKFDDCVIRLTPARWTWWDIGAAFQGVLDTPGYLLPLSPS